MSLIGNRRSNKGFLLLEIVISVAILTAGLLLVLNSFVRSIGAIELSRDYFKASLLGEEKMYELQNAQLTEGSSGGVFPDFNSEFSWRLSAKKIEENALKEADLEIYWQQGAKRKNISILTYLRE